jgi:hypothetical protein
VEAEARKEAADEDEDLEQGEAQFGALVGDEMVTRPAGHGGNYSFIN